MQPVLEVQDEVEEHRVERAVDPEGGDEAADEGRLAQQGEVEHRLAPGSLERREGGGRNSCTPTSVTRIATAPIGRLTKKIQRHESSVVSSPPRTGPRAPANVTTAPQMPNAMPRSRPWKVCASSASEVAKIVAPPIPCSARKATSSVPEPAIPHSSEPMVKMSRPPANTRRRPRMSASEPVGSSNAASDSE